MKIESAADVRLVGSQLSNWGRWGESDELGTLNHLTPERVRAAAACVRSGRAVSLSMELGDKGPWTPESGGRRYNPRHTMTVLGEIEFAGGFRFTDDSLDLPLQASTQWDALAHVFYDGFMYNGYAAETVTADGARFNSIDRVNDRLVGRGVLLDVARHRGVEYIEDGDAITSDDLDACASSQHVDVRPGDIVLVRVGMVGRAVRTGWWPGFVAASAGLSVTCAPWLYEHDIAAIAADNLGVEVMPHEVPDCAFPLHMIAMRNMGMMFGELWHLDDLSEACAAESRYEFMISAQPLRVTGGVGSPVNAMAIL